MLFVDLKAKPGKVTGFIKRSEPYLSMSEGTIDGVESGRRLFIEKDLNRTRRHITNDSYVVPRKVRQSWWCLNSGEAATWRSVNQKDSVVNGLLHAWIHGQMDIVEVESIDIVKDNDHRTLGPAYQDIKCKAGCVHVLQECKLEGSPRNARLPLAFHMQVGEGTVIAQFPVFEEGHLPGVKAGSL
jgi:hypothetical protein